MIFPNSLISIGSGAFQNCSNLASAIIPNSVTGIASSAFSQCSGLTNLTLGNSVTSIGSLAFVACFGLRNLVIPNSVSNLMSQAFQSCTNLTSVSIGRGVTAIGASAFQSCSNLTAVYFAGNAPTPTNTISVFTNTLVTVYYQPGTTGWGAIFDGRPTVLYAGALSVMNNLGATWSLDGGSFTNASGATRSSLIVTNHTIIFNPVNGYATPSNQIVAVGFNLTNSIVGNYVAVLTANNVVYNRNQLVAWQLRLSDLLANVTDPSSNVVSLASLGISTNGVTLAIRNGYLQYYNTNLVNDRFTYTVTNSIGDTASGIITLTAASAQALGGQVNSLTVSGGIATLNFAGIANYRYQIQVTTNLAGSWTTLLTTNASASGVFHYIDTNPPVGAAFYRLLWAGN